MAKSGGFPYAVIVDDDASQARTISNDVNSFSFATPRGVQDVTGVNVAAMERLLLLADFSATLNIVFNPAANMSHAVFSGDLAVPRTLDLEVHDQQLAPEVLFTDYALTRGSDGSLTGTVPAVLQNGVVPTWVDGS